MAGLRGWFLLVSAGCTAVPLDEVPIRGGTQEQRAAARNELVTFDEAVGGRRLTLHLVRFGNIKPSFAGRYRNQRVYLSPDLQVEEVPKVLRHELCHALDDLEGLSDAPVFERLGRGPLGSPIHPSAGADRHAGEAFAALCELGAAPAAVFGTPCPDAPTDLWLALAKLSDEVWLPGSPLPSTARSADPGASWVAPFAPESLSVVASVRAGVLYISLMSDDGASSSFQVYLESGAPAPSAGPSEGGDLELGDLPLFELLPFGLTVSEPAGWRAGPAAGLIKVSTKIGTFARVIVWDGASWSLLEDGCYPSDRSKAALFDAEQRIWMARADGATLSWAPLYP